MLFVEIEIVLNSLIFYINIFFLSFIPVFNHYLSCAQVSLSLSLSLFFFFFFSSPNVVDYLVRFIFKEFYLETSCHIDGFGM